jgi:hypothetical protein
MPEEVKTYLEHDNLQHQPVSLLRTAVRARRALLHNAARIRTRAAGMGRAVRTSARVRFQAVGQRDADHGVEILSDLLAADSSAQAQAVCQAIMQGKFLVWELALQWSRRSLGVIFAVWLRS